jgi:ATP-binding protein involved in chromosome partitioning
MSQNPQRLQAQATELLLELADNPSSGLADRSKAEISKYASVEDGDDLCRLVIVSDGLSLEQKSFIEQFLHSELVNAGISKGSFTIYFRRSKSPSAGGPAPAQKSESPYGLSINKRAIPGVREVVLIASGKGGVGKSTVSTNLAVTMARLGHKVGYLDADIYGPSGPTMLGVKGPLGVSEGEKIIPVEAHGVKIVSFGFIADSREPVIWRGPMIGKAIDQMCFRTEWGELDYLIVDLPPGTGDVQISLIEGLPLHGAIIVTTPQNVALLDAHKAQSMFESLKVPVIGIIENMSYYQCPKCGHEDHIFGAGGGDRFAGERGLPLLGRIPILGEIREQSDAGVPVSLGSNHTIKDVYESTAEAVLKLGRPLH